MLDVTACPPPAAMPSKAGARRVFRRDLLLAALSMPMARSAAGAALPAAAGQDTKAVVVFGDSQAQGLAAALQRLGRHRPGFSIRDRTRPGTAISQPKNYDWPATIRSYVPENDVAAALLMFGGNDRLPMRLAAGASVPFRSAPWEAEYRGRVADILRDLTASRLRVVWVGDPICRDAAYSRDMAYLNAIYRDALDGSGATYVDIWSLVADDRGDYAAYGRGPDGVMARLRLDDGIHFTPAGYDIIAVRVYPSLAATAEGPR